jgi:moderate conductance mechanosensitive channel
MAAQDVADRALEWALVHLPSVGRIVIILALAYALTRILRRLLLRFEGAAWAQDAVAALEREKRAKTLSRVLRQTFGILIWTVVLSMVLGELGLDLKPILAGAGIAGLAVGFGAQTLVKDVIAGFFILMENQFRVKDVIATAGVGGAVEAINLRTTVLRDSEGRVHVIPNGTIGVVTNFTREWSRALLDVRVSYREDTDRCLAVLREVGESMERDPDFSPKLAGRFEYPGIEQLEESTVLIRMLVDTHPQERWNVLRELRRRVKKAFDEKGIEMTPPLVTRPIPPRSEPA